MVLIQNAHIINPDRCFNADIVIRNGKIESFEQPGTLSEGEKIIDAKGLYVVPGGFDPHVHLSLPGPAGMSADDFHTGSIAALAGGVTHIMDFVTPRRGQNLEEALKERMTDTEKCHTGLTMHMGISGQLPNMKKQMEICVKDHGIKSFKVYLAYKNTIGIDAEQLENIMSIAAGLDAVVLVHAEDGDTIEQLQQDFILRKMTHPRYHALSRPPETESRAVETVIRLIEATGCHTYFVHISTADSAELIATAKQKGMPVFAETCPQYLLLDDHVYEGSLEQTVAYVFSPPPRPPIHKKILFKHLQSGTFDTVATDHCPFSLKQKLKGKDFTQIPNGAGGLEFRIPLLYHYGVSHQKIDLQQWVKLISTNAASVFGHTDKGRLAPGLKANLFLFDPEANITITAANQYQNCDINIYEGVKIKGRVTTVIMNGEICFPFGQTE
jgi:dihydropyrimidinase